MNTDQKYKLLSMMGYKGPKNESLMSSFVESNPAAGAKMGQFMSASKGFNKGGMVGYAAGGYVMGPNNTIMKPDGTTHQTYGSLAQAYNALQALNNPPATTAAPTGSTTPVPNPVQQPTVTPPTGSTGGVQVTNTPEGRTATATVSREDFNRMSLTQQRRLAERFPSQPYSSWLITAQSQPVQPPAPAPQPTTTQPSTTTTTPRPTPTQQPTQTNYTGQQAQINQLYQRYLGRDAQQAGMDFYSGLLSSGQIDLAGIEQDLARNAATERTVRQTYADMGLNVDQAGLQFYTGLLNSGRLTPEQMRQDIQQNIQRSGTTGGTQVGGPPVTQPANDAIVQAYRNALGREPDAAGLAYWTQQRAAGVPEAEIVAQLQATGGAGTTFQPEDQTEAQKLQEVGDAYRSIFGRNPDQAGLDFYMNSGLSSEEIINNLIVSQEAQLIANQRYDEARALRQAQQNYMRSAFQSPQDLVTGQEVAQVEATDGTLIPTDQGQVSGTVGYDASTIDPNSGIGQAQAPADIGTATYEAQQISDQLQGTLGDLEAQTADPSAKATVRGQLEILMDDFEDGTPPWASGAMRQATAIMQQRGLGASSMAGQAITQAALEAATNIAQQDAQTFATFELRNLDNRQQTAIFKAQQRITGLFTDQAATNAARQFNASSENQTNQFMASLQESVSRFNASQVAAIAEINVNSENAAKQFNSQMTDLRERFNASNSLVISQANAQWRQNLNTINTAAQNDANRDYVKTVNAITTAALDQLWQRERDLMTFAFSGSESAADRELQMLLADRQEDLVRWQEGKAEDAAWGELLGSVVSKVFDW